MGIDKTEIGKRLREFAKTQGGVGKLAESLNMSIQTLSGGYISGRNLPGAEVIFRLMELGCNIEWLFSGRDNSVTITAEDSPINNSLKQRHDNRDLLKIEIAQRLKEYVSKNFRNNRDLADMLNINDSSLSHYVNAKRELNPRILRKLQQVGCDIEWLVTGKENPNNNISDKGLVNKSPIQGQANTESNQMTIGNTIELEVLREKVKFIEEKNKLLEDHVNDLRKENNFLLNQLTKNNH